MSLAEIDSYPEGVDSLKKESCRPNYQRMATVLKKKVERTKNLYDTIHTSLDVLPYDVKRKEFTIFELIGFLDVTLRKYGIEYEALLKEIENEKADGSSV